MSGQELALWASVLISMAAFGYAIMGNRNKKNSIRMHELATRIDALEDRASRIETDMKHLPDKDTAHMLELGLSQLNGRVEALTEKLAPVTAMASRIQEALIERVSSQ